MISLQQLVDADLNKYRCFSKTLFRNNNTDFTGFYTAAKGFFKFLTGLRSIKSCLIITDSLFLLCFAAGFVFLDQFISYTLRYFAVLGKFH